MIGQERERLKQGGSYWSDWDEEKGDWLEGSLHLNGIFNTCFVAWQELAWPDIELHLDFGIQLFKVGGLLEFVKKS